MKDCSRTEKRANSSSKFNTDLFNKPFSSTGQNHNESVSSHNDSIYSLQSSTSKKKPFDSIEFSQNKKFSDSQKLSVTNQKSQAETEITSKQRKEDSKVEQSQSGLSVSSVKKNLLDKDIIDRAIKFNKATQQENLPFWVKFCVEDKTELDKNSSYFKVNDKEKFLKNMLEMTKNDAKLQEMDSNLKMTKEKTYQGLQNLLLTELNQETKNKPLAKATKSALSKYDNRKKLEKESQNAELNFYDFKKKQNNKKDSHTKANIQNAGTMPMRKYAYPQPLVLNEEEVYKDDDQIMTIDQLDPEKDNYLDVDYGFYNKAALKNLFDIDKRLAELNPSNEAFSTKNELKKVQEEYRAQKKGKPGKVLLL